jgi:hypothetical protein
MPISSRFGLILNPYPAIAPVDFKGTQLQKYQKALNYAFSVHYNFNFLNNPAALIEKEINKLKLNESSGFISLRDQEKKIQSEDFREFFSIENLFDHSGVENIRLLTKKIGSGAVERFVKKQEQNLDAAEAALKYKKQEEQKKREEQKIRKRETLFKILHLKFNPVEEQLVVDFFF